MSNLPESLYEDEKPSGAGSSSSSSSVGASRLEPRGELNGLSVDQLIALIGPLGNPQTREQAIKILVENKEIREELGPLLWNSRHTIFTLLQEIMAVYRLLSSPNLTRKASNQVCNALALFERIASHPDTRMPFIKANIPLYLFPFLDTTNKEKPHEFLRLTSLGVIGAMVKVDNAEVIQFLLDNQVLPHCLRCMEVGNELSKTVATFILHKILIHERGLKYCCAFGERFHVIARALANMVEELAQQPSQRLLKFIIYCYLRLSENARVCYGLGTLLPPRFRDANFINLLHEDPVAIDALNQLFVNVANGQSLKHKQLGRYLGTLDD